MRIFVLLTVALLAACGDKEPPSPPPAPQVATPPQLSMDEALARARALDAARDRMQTVPGTFQAGDASSRYVAYFDSGVLRLIDERSDFGDYGSSAARYYLDTTSKLFLYQAQDERTVTGGAGTGGRERVEVSMLFDPDERLLASEKKVDGKVQPIQATEIEGVRRHVEALRTSIVR